MRPSLSFLRNGLSLVALSLVASAARADEGQWMPSQIKDLDPVALKKAGLTLTAEQLYSETGGLLRAAVNLSGCTAAFVSADGLIATNHHCAYGAIQGNSDLAHDYLKDGFVAKTRGEELAAKDLTIKVLEKVEDVTAEVNAAAAAAKDDRARARAIDRARKGLVDACEKAKPFARCEVASFYSGSQYQRITYRELRDVRLVYAPPAALGDYGGEEDNWMWPRHTGDFSLLRAYGNASGEPAEPAKDNVPYHPAVYLKTATAGVSEGGFVGILGYPGRTQRYLPVVEVSRLIDQVYPARIDLFGEWISIFEELGSQNAATKIKVAANKKSFANRYKNAQGMIAGLRAMKLVERRTEEEAELARFVALPENAKDADVVPETRTLSQRRREGFDRDFLLENLSRAGTLLPNAIDVVRRAREAKKPDLERVTGYQDRDKKQLGDRVARRTRDFDFDVDVQLVAALLARFARLPEAQRSAALQPHTTATADAGDGPSSPPQRESSWRPRGWPKRTTRRAPKRSSWQTPKR